MIGAVVQGWSTDSNCLGPALARADANAVLQWQNEDFSVADSPLRPSTRGLHDGVHRRFDEILVNGDLKLHFLQEIHGQFVAAINFRMTFLPADPIHKDSTSVVINGNGT